MSAHNKSPLDVNLLPLSIARILWIHYWIVLVMTMLGTAASFVVVRRLPAVYRSEALILIDSQEIPERYVASAVNKGVQDRLATITAEILSATRLRMIIDKFALYRERQRNMGKEEIITLMRKDITVQLEKGWTQDRPGAFRVGYQGQKALLVSEVANELAHLFVEANLRTRSREAKGTADFIDNQLLDAKKTLDQLEAKLKEYKLAHNGDLPEQQSALSATLNRLQFEAQGNQEAMNRAVQNKVLLQGAIDMAEAASGAGSLPSDDSTLKTDANGSQIVPQKESEFLQSQYDTLNKRYEPKYPRMIILEHEIEKQKLAEDRERARVDNLRTQMILANEDIDQRNKERDRLLKSIAQYQAKIEQLPIREQDVAALTRDYEISKANYKSLLDKKLAARSAAEMETRQQAERFTILDPPQVPEKAIKPNRPLLAAVGCALSLVMSLAFVIVKEIQKNAFLGEWELPTEVVVLGRIPFFSANSSLRSNHGVEKRAAKWKALFSTAPRFVVTVRVMSKPRYGGRP